MYWLLLSLLPSVVLSDTASECQQEGVECVNSPTDSLIKVNSVQPSQPTPSAAERPPGVAGLTKEECSERLSDREQGFYSFSRALDKTQLETVPRVQTALIAAEQTVGSLLDRQTRYSGELIEVNSLMSKGLERAQVLLAWERDETQVRGALRQLFDDLHKEVLRDSDAINETSRKLRDAIRKMQVENDKVTKVMTKVADAQTGTYQWAYKATAQINQHTKRLLGMNEEVLVKKAQVDNNKIITDSLLKIVAELAQKHPEVKDDAKAILGSDKLFEEAFNSIRVSAGSAAGSSQTVFL